MNLDQLDAAYRADVIDETSLVWQPGFTEWLPLSEFLGALPIAPIFPASAYPTASEARGSSSAPAVSYTLGSNSRPLPSAPPSFGPILVPEVSPWFRRALLGLTAVVAIVAFHQNGGTMSFASTRRERTAMAGIEADLLGSWSLLTPHGIEVWMERVQEETSLGKLVDPSRFLADEKARQAAENQPKVDPAPSPEAPPPPISKAPHSSVPSDPPGVTAAPETPSPLPSTASEAPKDLRSSELPASSFQEALSGKATTPKPGAGKSRSSSFRKPASRQKSTSAADAYDPMNGAL